MKGVGVIRTFNSFCCVLVREFVTILTRTFSKLELMPQIPKTCRSVIEVK